VKEEVYENGRETPIWILHFLVLVMSLNNHPETKFIVDDKATPGPSNLKHIGNQQRTRLKGRLRFPYNNVID